MRPAAWLWLPLLLGCTERTRPDPSGPGNPIQLTAQLVTPQSNETLSAGTSVNVRVRGTEKGLRLNGLGFVARRFQGGLLDSVIINFAARADTTLVFSYRIPVDLPTNAQIDFVGVAYSGTSTLRSVPASVIIIACVPNGTCRP